MNESLISKMESLPLEAAVRAGDSVFSQADKAAINAAYSDLFSKNVKDCSCGHRYIDAAMEIIAALKIKSRSMNRKYELKAGRLIWVDNNPYSNANLTDEVSAKWCAEHPDLIAINFQRWEDPTTEKPQTALKPKKKAKK